MSEARASPLTARPDNFFDRARARLTLEVPPALTNPAAQGARGDLDLGGRIGTNGNAVRTPDSDSRGVDALGIDVPVAIPEVVPDDHRATIERGNDDRRRLRLRVVDERRSIGLPRCFGGRMRQSEGCEQADQEQLGQRAS